MSESWRKDDHGTTEFSRKINQLGLSRRTYLLSSVLFSAHGILGRASPAGATEAASSKVVLELRGDAPGDRFDGIGVVNGGGATSVLLKDYPEPQRSQILDLLYKPKFGASVSALLVEIPGDGNSTQGSMPSHMHSREDLNFHRGYTWWILSEAKERNPRLSLDATAWSAPGWLGTEGKLFPRMEGQGDAKFFSPDTIDYYVHWLDGLRREYRLELDAIGVRNEKGVSYEFAKEFRRSLNERGYSKVKLHAFDNWPEWKLDFVKDMVADRELRDSIDIISAHTFYSNFKVSPEVKAAAKAMGKPIWNSEDHVYKKGFDCAISIVECFNRNYIDSGATKVVNWYDIAGIYALEPYSEDPAALLAHEPWSGHYKVREALWGYAHYGQFSEIGWTYPAGGSGSLPMGGSYVSLKSSDGEFSVIIETKGASASQEMSIEVGPGMARRPLCVWRSNASEQFVRLADLTLKKGICSVTLEPDCIYSLSSTRGQQKGGFADIPPSSSFPFPYSENFAPYARPKDWGYLPRFTADIAGAFELSRRPDGDGHCLRQVVPVPTISWAPDWRPYTILGDSEWTDYEVSASIWLNPGDTAGVMGRINHVGTGYGFIPKGYFFEIADGGVCRLVAIRGKKNPKAPVGDAEQQAMVQKAKPIEGGELVLASTTHTPLSSGRWHKLTLRFKGEEITGLIDGVAILKALDSLYGNGMAGLLAGQTAEKVSTPYYADLTVGPEAAKSGQSNTPADFRPIYAR
ncbi:galactosylceramidase [Sphingobium sp. AP50]|uniref:galactosylceramidase n=1 Tax=Sphingobium sp. AP50 TaxID=1884369 RepID=UPI0008CB60D1|nr:galactosylceramidase [Sphingobium sp. AP50]SEJ73629.1 galactosylceramidase [Sphingobium sp. AP50]